MSVRVSVVLPIYNYAHYLDERLRSLFAQTYQDFEIIAVDDGSTDGSRAVVEKYASDPRLRTLWFDENGGLPYLRWNDGAAVARGELLLFAGADDSCEPALLERLVAAVDAHPRVGIAHARSWMIDPDGNRLSLLPEAERWSSDFVADAGEEVPHLLRTNTIPNASAALLRRSVFEACGRFDTSIRLCADWMLWARMLLCSDVAYVAEPLNYFRVHNRTLRRTEGPLTAVLERYQVMAFMLEAFSVSPEVRERACEATARAWIRRLGKIGSKEALAVDMQTYGLARAVDHKLHRRLARLAKGSMVPALRKRLGLRTRARRFLSSSSEDHGDRDSRSADRTPNGEAQQGNR